MSLRLKIVILIAGSLIIPVIVGVISLKFSADMNEVSVHRRALMAHKLWMLETGEKTIDIDRLKEELSNVPANAEVRVFHQDGVLLFASERDFSDASTGRYHITESLPIQFTNGDTGTVVVTRQPSPFLRDADRWYIPLTGLLFLTTMVVVIVNSINRSIGRLEKATRRIAEGDLDFDLPIKGKDKFASLTKSFDSMREHLKEEYARRARFIMGISHDLKTPLSSIGGYTSAINEGYADTPEKLEKYVGIIEDKTQLLESRISMLIDYVKRETSDWKSNLQPVELNPFFCELSTVFESETAIKRREYSGEILIPDGLTVGMDEGMVVRAFENLMHNAISYSPEGSAIEFSCIYADDLVRVSLRNAGKGIDPAALPHIFDPFFRSAGDRKGKGLGLGLSTVNSVISSHGWKVDVDSEPDKVTTFTVTIPIE